jgi:hypothetical protein
MHDYIFRVASSLARRSVTNQHSIGVFATASQNLRNILAFFYSELAMPTETIKLQVDGIIQSFAVEEHYERERHLSPKPEGS